MIINKSNLDSLYTVYKTRFMNAFSSQVNEHNSWWKTEPSTTKTEDFPLLLQSPGMREWIGDKEIKNIGADKLSLSNRDFEDTYGVDRNEIEDNKAISLASIFAIMGTNAKNLHPDIAFEALVANAAWIDGKLFFSADRKYGKNVIKNYTTEAFSQTTFDAGRLTMAGYRGHGNKSLKVKATRLIVGPDLQATAEDIVLKRVLANGSDNLNYKRVELEIHEDLVGDYAKYWFLLDDRDNNIPPVIVLNRKAPEFVSLDKTDDDNVFFQKKFIYGVEARAVAGKTLPHRIYGGFVAP